MPAVHRLSGACHQDGDAGVDITAYGRWTWQRPLFRKAAMIRSAFCAFAGFATIAAAPLSAASPSPGDLRVRPPCTQSTSACLETVAKTYIAALVSHDGSKIPLAPDVRRTENALTNAKGAYEVRQSFAQTRMVEGYRDLRFWTNPATGDIVAFFMIDVDLKAADATTTTRSGDTEYKVSVKVPAGTYTVHEAERFRIVHGMITQIEILAHPEAGKGLGSGWPVPRDAAVGAAK
jgi:hypothetical protein